MYNRERWGGDVILRRFHVSQVRTTGIRIGRWITMVWLENEYRVVGFEGRYGIIR